MLGRLTRDRELKQVSCKYSALLNRGRLTRDRELKLLFIRKQYQCNMAVASRATVN